MMSQSRPCAHVPAAFMLGSAGALALAGSASAGVTLLDFSWTSSANTTQVAQATCEDACPGGLAICTASEPSFFLSGSSMTEIDGVTVAGRYCTNSCGDTLQVSANSGVATYIAIKPPLAAGDTQLWNFAHSITTGAEATLVDNGCGAGDASASASAHHTWNLVFRVDELTELTMNYTHTAMRDGRSPGAVSNWTIRDSNGQALFEQHVGGPLGIPSEQGTLLWNLEPGNYTLNIDADVNGLALANGPTANPSASASCELLFRPFGCARIVAQTNDLTIASTEDLTLGVIVDPPVIGREFQWQLRSSIPPYTWTDIANGTFFLASGDLILPVGQVSGADTGTLFIDLDPQYASILSGSTFRCAVADTCGSALSRPIEVTVTDGASACPACAADYDQDGGVTGNDLVAFFDAWQIGAACADLDDDGGVTAGDLGVFFAAFELGGC